MADPAPAHCGLLRAGSLSIFSEGWDCVVTLVTLGESNLTVATQKHYGQHGKGQPRPGGAAEEGEQRVHGVGGAGGGAEGGVLLTLCWATWSGGRQHGILDGGPGV